MGDEARSERGSIEPVSSTDSHGLGSLIGVTADGFFLLSCGKIIPQEVVFSLARRTRRREAQRESQLLFEELTAQIVEWEARAKERAALDETERKIRLENQRLREIGRAKEEADWERQQAEIDRRIKMGDIPTGPKSR
jgi:peptidyl-tRNA hydrolase